MNTYITCQLKYCICRCVVAALVLEKGEKKFQETPSILDMEMFHLLVQLVLSLPVLYCEDEEESLATPSSAKASSSSNKQMMRIPTGGLNEQHILQLVFTAHIVQIMLTMVVCPQGNSCCALHFILVFVICLLSSFL